MRMRAAGGTLAFMIRTLIVDDHPAVRQGLLTVLRAEPGIVPIAAGGDSSSALAIAASEEVRCAVVDLELGDEDGLELIRQLCALPNPPGIVFYSAFTPPDITRAALDAGAGATVPKGAPIQQVIDAVKEVGRRRPRAIA
jgi:DNA-binding NarL/FixJ family response regulator